MLLWALDYMEQENTSLKVTCDSFVIPLCCLRIVSSSSIWVCLPQSLIIECKRVPPWGCREAQLNCVGSWEHLPPSPCTHPGSTPLKELPMTLLWLILSLAAVLWWRSWKKNKINKQTKTQTQVLFCFLSKNTEIMVYSVKQSFL